MISSIGEISVDVPITQLIVHNNKEIVDAHIRDTDSRVENRRLLEALNSPQ
jgi:hypothetical protein